MAASAATLDLSPVLAPINEPNQPTLSFTAQRNFAVRSSNNLFASKIVLADAWNCVPITQSTTSTPVNDPDWHDPIKAFGAIAGLFGQRSSETVLHLSLDVLNWSSGCQSKNGELVIKDGHPLRMSTPNFLTQTPATNGGFIIDARRC